MRNQILCLTAAAVMALACRPAIAIDRAYLGTWGDDLKHCNLSPDGAMQITGSGFKTYEALCTTIRARRDRTGWSMTFTCQAEGAGPPIRLHWSLIGKNTLKETLMGGDSTFVRCRKS